MKETKTSYLPRRMSLGLKNCVSTHLFMVKEGRYVNFCAFFLFSQFVKEQAKSFAKSIKDLFCFRY